MNNSRDRESNLMHIACLDFEGVLVPEIWVGLAEQTGIERLRLTTRDISDYDELMTLRLECMREHGLKFADIRAAANQLEPLPGAAKFLKWLRSTYQVTIISDTFYELAAPLIEKLEFPVILCHRLDFDEEGNISGYRLRQTDPKRKSVQAFQSLNYRVVATGDSYNDVSMLDQADRGIFFMPPQNVCDDHPAIPVAQNYAELRKFFEDANAELPPLVN